MDDVKPSIGQTIMNKLFGDLFSQSTLEAYEKMTSDTGRLLFLLGIGAITLLRYHYLILLAGKLLSLI